MSRQQAQEPDATPTSYSVRPIGVVRSPRAVPRHDHWGGVTSLIELDPTVLRPEAVTGLEQFSHLEVVFHFHLVPESDAVTGAVHPRGRTDLPRLGILAQRLKERPNRLGVSRCELVRVDGLTLHVRALDALDGTPVLDVKPYQRLFAPDSGAVREPAWLHEAMSAYYF
ncbi:MULTISPECIES: tRNA (N6-threonylcarbamoyladenosine(37)-N6)-methyltransferase TrmO [unclassified Streptomyces]|uniref:tRNA (N6-threonylcarbamoyladenosine(37)-N6)-methyltransferase TrmO n=1 Tax=unclassified Streptomyces TaxID=2593676 RepID=UPI00190A4974|nr:MULTISPECIES: tRNA (N6-threonylcarbamoyladenosine(37)-N6)-methyltransferase TrmO [unclassified Streptomyces]MBK3568636.1 tRNA (N6-threonylcarbamoyladenosine(37)-N6)-methyltransferase TrmO [Streptomyces sp. MBT62]MBK6018232.1 tRNA (N6-threonylcarbamoyladenosine(37)-N6)-methyltransferase TrmO [Streptomyces sp. MBT53]